MLALALVGAGAGALSKNRPARARAPRQRCLGLYTLLWHGIWSNLPIHEPSMAYEVHARFWMQPHLLVCVMAGAGAAAAWRARAPKPLPAAALALCVCVVASRVAALWPRWTSPPSLCSRRTAPPRSRRCRRAACYCRTRTSTGIRRATSAPAGGKARRDAPVVQLPVPVVRAAPAASEDEAMAGRRGASTDPATERYERLVEDVATGNLDAFPAGIYLDLHGVHEPHIGRLGSWRGR